MGIIKEKKAKVRMLSKLLAIAALTALPTVSGIQLTYPGFGGTGDSACENGFLGGCVENPCADEDNCGDDDDAIPDPPRPFDPTNWSPTSPPKTETACEND